jgi:branched-chain amino acid transport system substrate-binding protein
LNEEDVLASAGHRRRVSCGRGGASAQLKIGVAGPLTGPNAAFGAQLKNGAEQAAADINAKGGINGQKIELSFGDDVSDPKQGVSVPTSSSARRQVRDRPLQLRRHHPASEVYQENGIYMITPSATNPKSPSAACGTCSAPAARRPARRGAGKYIATIQGQEDRHRPRQDHLRPGLGRRDQEGDDQGRHEGGALRGHQSRREGLLRPRVQDQGAGADLVYWGGLHTEGGLLVRQMRDQGVKAR